MDIKLYVNSSEKNKIGKTLTSELVLTGTLREMCDVINPSILIEGENFTGYNYAKIPAFGRSYFIESMEVLREDLWRINLAVDVLDSFKTSILAQNVILSDSKENGASDYLDGDQWTSKVKAFTDIINFSSGLNNNGEYILITAGG